MSAWCGIRPLVVDAALAARPTADNPSGKATATATASRDHVIHQDEETGIVYALGGKWTTYREMWVTAVTAVRALARFLYGVVL